MFVMWGVKILPKQEFWQTRLFKYRQKKQKSKKKTLKTLSKNKLCLIFALAENDQRK
jgi:hypothetical protein